MLKLGGPKGSKWTVQKTSNRRSEKEKLNCLKKENWTVTRDESRRSKKILTSMLVLNVGNPMWGNMG